MANRVQKTADQLWADFREAVTLLEAQCRMHDTGFLSASKMIANLLHQLADDRGRNVSHLTKIDIRASLALWIHPPTPPNGEGYHNNLVGFAMGVRRHPITGAMSPAAQVVPNFMSPLNIDRPIAALGVEEWLDEPVVRIRDEEWISRRALIREVRDTDAGAHSDGALAEIYAAFKESTPIAPQSMVEIHGKATSIKELMPNPVLGTLRQLAHELLSAIYSRSGLMPSIRPKCIVFKFDYEGTVEAIHRPIGYPGLPFPLPSALIVPH